ncbi:MAG: hypothetical protein WC501_05625 [Candidatus Micrarchaeia archaeon]
MTNPDPLDELLDVCASSDSYKIDVKKKLDLELIEKKLKDIWEIAAKTPVVILIKTDRGAISVYKSGKILFKNFEKEKAKEYGRKLMKLIGEKFAD